MGRVEGHGVPKPPHPPAGASGSGGGVEWLPRGRGTRQRFPGARLHRNGMRWSVVVAEPGARTRVLLDVAALDITVETAEEVAHLLAGTLDDRIPRRPTTEGGPGDGS